MDKDDASKSTPFTIDAAAAPPDRASESVVSTVDPHDLRRDKMPPVKQTPAISSGPFEIAALAASDSDPPPAPAAVSIEHAMGRARGVVPLSRIIAIAAVVFAVVVLLIVIVLFR